MLLSSVKAPTENKSKISGSKKETIMRDNLQRFGQDSGSQLNLLEQAEIRNYGEGFPGDAVVGSLPANGGDMGSRPGLGRSHMPRSN